MNPFVPEQKKEPYRNALATVVGVTDDGVLIRTADGTIHEKPCGRLASYSPTIDDRVYIVPFGKSSTSYLIIGKVV